MVLIGHEHEHPTHVHYVVEVAVNCHDPGDFTKAAEILNRALVGLALDGIDGSMETLRVELRSHDGEAEGEPVEP